MLRHSHLRFINSRKPQTACGAVQRSDENALYAYIVAQVVHVCDTRNRIYYYKTCLFCKRKRRYVWMKYELLTQCC